MSGKSAIVVGSGIAGMTAAYRLNKAGFSVRVLEAEHIIGGRMSCRRIDGYTFNRAATVLGGSYDFIRGLVEEIGLSDRLKFSDFKIGTYRDGRIFPVRTNRVIVDSLLSGLLSWRSKSLMLRVIHDAKKARKYLNFSDLSLAAPIDDETVASYAARRLNKELLEYVVEPTMAAVLATTPNKASIVDFLFSIAHYIGMGVYRFDGGIDFLVEKIAKQVTVETNARVHSVTEDNEGVEVHWERSGKNRRGTD